MAKKNLASLMDGILGDSNTNDETTAKAPQITESMNADLQTKRYEKVGRPRKNEEKVASKDIRATIIADSDVMRKIKYISVVDGILIKDVIGDALQKKIEDWETENGKIKFPSR